MTRLTCFLLFQDREELVHSSRERCASRASQHVYGVSDEEEEEEARDRMPSPRPPSRGKSPSSPRAASPRRLRRTISGALDITEDVGLVAVGANPNLSKIWHHAYMKEIAHQHHHDHHHDHHRQPSPRPSPRSSPLLGPRPRASPKLRGSPHLGRGGEGEGGREGGEKRKIYLTCFTVA